jgi:hypothetical protein
MTFVVQIVLTLLRIAGANCDIRGYMQCFSPILNVVGAKFVNGTSLGWLLPMSALLSGSPSDIQPLCR